VIRPPASSGPDFTVRRQGEGWRVLGGKPERWVRQTDFSNDEAVGYLGDRLARLGVEEELFRAGAVAGSEVLIGPGENAVVFDWEPTMVGGAELLAGPRGSDLRLDESRRPTRDAKREQHSARMDAKADARGQLAGERAAGRWVDPADPRDASAGHDTDADATAAHEAAAHVAPADRDAATQD